MSIFGHSIRIRGEVRSSADLTIEGQVSGPVTCDGGVVTIAASAIIEGDVMAADITVFGRAAGQLIATEVVDIRPAATVAGAVIAPKLILHDGAQFSGRVDPNRLETALSVARFQQKKRDEAAATNGAPGL
jgi:cytoskeletal protein CcmA (bactofilin family)